MSTRVTFGKLILGVVAVLVPGCGGDEEDNGNTPSSATVQSGVPPEKAVNSLSEAEAKQVSASFAEAIETSGLVDALCVLGGIFAEQVGAAAGGAATTCEQAAADCKAAPTETTQNTLSVSEDPAELSTCTITVGALETCMNAMLKQLGGSLGNVTCDSELQTVMQAFASGSQVAACETVNTTCPTLLSSGAATATP